MDSDTKIRLLVGLVFIFVIAFVINGVPRFGDATNSKAPSAPEIDGTPGIGARERNIINRPTEPVVPEPATDEGSEVPESEPVKPALAKVYYTVSEGDNLADIAKKFYGPKKGNRRANVMRLFEANRRVLKSPDKIYPGQKLIIPPLGALEPDKNSTENIFSDSMSEKAASIGRRHFLDQSWVNRICVRNASVASGE